MRLPICLLVLLIGCDGAPPFDELPLRDGLRASPDTVAALAPEARARFAARLIASRADPGVDDVSGAPPGPGARVQALDRARESRGADALVIGTIDGVGRAHVLPAAVTGEATLRLDDLPGTTPLERRALAGEAGASLRALAATSGARRLHRVVGWPVGAVAIGDTIYVNGSWLVALASEDDAGGDAGGPAASSSAAPLTGPPTAPGSPPSAATPISRIIRSQSAPAPDAGAPGPEPDLPTEDPDPTSSDACPAFLDACGSGADACGSSDGSDDACASGDDSSGDSCDSGDDSDGCSGSGGSDDACAAPPDDGGGSCQVSRRGRPSGVATFACLLAPLGFLVARGRR
jgi:hypothetical protein